MALRGVARPGLPRDPCKKVAVAVSMMAIAAAGGGIAATAAQAGTEVLGATATTFTGGGGGLCSKGSGSAIFRIATGAAMGPYPGAFTETNANAERLGERLNPVEHAQALDPVHDQLSTAQPSPVWSPTHPPTLAGLWSAAAVASMSLACS